MWTGRQDRLSWVDGSNDNHDNELKPSNTYLNERKTDTFLSINYWLHLNTYNLSILR